MRDSAGECADTIHPLSAEELLLQSLALGDVGVDDQNGARLAVVVAEQGDAAIDRHRRSRRSRFHDLAAPPSGLPHQALCDFDFFWSDAEQLVRSMADCVRAGPSIESLGSLVPEDDSTGEILDEDSVGGFIDECRLSLYLGVRLLPLQLSSCSRSEDPEGGGNEILLRQWLSKQDVHQSDDLPAGIEQIGAGASLDRHRRQCRVLRVQAIGIARHDAEIVRKGLLAWQLARRVIETGDDPSADDGAERT